jgi:NAD-dependent SIR2 family protein deacetylase
MSESLRLVYCPHCEKRLTEPIRAATRSVLGACPRCGGQARLWPAELPLPTEANIRALWGFLRCVPADQTGGRRVPVSKVRGRWS